MTSPALEIAVQLLCSEAYLILVRTRLTSDIDSSSARDCSADFLRDLFDLSTHKADLRDGPSRARDPSAVFCLLIFLSSSRVAIGGIRKV